MVFFIKRFDLVPTTKEGLKKNQWSIEAIKDLQIMIIPETDNRKRPAKKKSANEKYLWRKSKRNKKKKYIEIK